MGLADGVGALGKTVFQLDGLIRRGGAEVRREVSQTLVQSQLGTNPFDCVFVENALADLVFTRQLPHANY